MNNPTRPRNGVSRIRIRIGLLVTFIGLVIYLLGAAPELFGLNRSPVTGFIQIAVFLVGLAGICIGGYISLNALWNGHQKSIGADIGLRLVSTGYVIAVASGMADMFGIGNHPFPRIPYFGAWQAFGVLVGEAVIALGFMLIIPFTFRAFRK
ncbi:MAG: hypothetical protein A2W33_10170 [Chloroflexi bacterium RBG_16_52_11]|nr:MAG: hypothetical protein A2W33_10170 [Chloroflexi bacterium RBG_16_52_11]